MTYLINFSLILFVLFFPLYSIHYLIRVSCTFTCCFSLRFVFSFDGTLLSHLPFSRPYILHFWFSFLRI